MERKKKLRLFQLSLFLIGVIFLYFTYYGRNDNVTQKIIPKIDQERIKNQIANQPEGYEMFTDIEYSGLDLAGNRYILRSAKAFNEKDNQEIVNLFLVEAFFYFKDDKILKVNSEEGIYNNKTLDMTFIKNVEANYDNSELYAQKAEYSNINGSLIISENVKLIDVRGTVFADKLFFDIKKQTLSVNALDDNKINADIKIK